MPPGGINQITPPLGGTMSGYNCYISFYMTAVSTGAAEPTAAPLSEQRPGAPTGVSVSYAGSFVVTTWTDPVEVIAGAQIRLWLRSEMGIYHRQMHTYYALAAQTSSLTGARSAQGKTILFSVPELSGGDTVTVQLDTVNPSGLRSAGSTIDSAAIA